MLRIAVCAVLSLGFAVVGCGGSSTSGDGGGGSTSSAGSSSSAGSTSSSGASSGGSTSSAGASSGGNTSSAGSTGSAGSSSTGGSSAGDFSTSVPGSTPLGNLSDSQTTALCSDLEAYTAKSNLLKVSCGLDGLLAAQTATDTSDAGLQAACKGAYDSCNADSTATTTCDKPSAACTATVAELTACLNDTAQEFDSISVPECSTLTSATLSLAFAGLAGLSTDQTAACKTYDAKCPDSGMQPTPGM